MKSRNDPWKLPLLLLCTEGGSFNNWWKDDLSEHSDISEVAFFQRNNLLSNITLNCSPKNTSQIKNVVTILIIKNDLVWIFSNKYLHFLTSSAENSSLLTCSIVPECTKFLRSIILQDSILGFKLRYELMYFESTQKSLCSTMLKQYYC